MPDINRDKIAQFLHAIITSPSGHLLIAVGDGSEWWEEYFGFPDEIEKALDYIELQAPKYNVYFSAHLFKSHDSHKANALPTRTIQADLDDAAVETATITPNLLIETSPGRHQAYWVLDQDVELDILEVYSRNLTYSIPLCDKSGWTIGHRVRVPYTFNYKRAPTVDFITIVNASADKTTTEKLEQLPKVSQLALEHYDQEWLDSVGLIDPGIGPQELLQSVKDKIPPKIHAIYNLVQEDRSAYLWGLTCAAFRAGLPRDQVFWLAKHSPNNKFSDLKYHADLELAKDVLRAQEAVRSQTTDTKTAILSIRKQKASSLEKRQLIAKMVIERMKVEGTFIHSNENTSWYIRKDQGRPIAIARISEMLQTLLAIEFGLNAVESEQHYVKNEIESYCLNLPESGYVCSMSYFDSRNPEYIFLHTGRQVVLRISSKVIEEVPQGYNNLVFPWNPFVDAVTPLYDPEFDWAEFLFKDSLKGMIDIPYENASALLHVWILFLLFRHAATARPILAFIGQPGAGKSTLFRKIYTALYGSRRDLIGVTKQEDFDHAVASDCLVVLDGVDSFEQWLPDRLSLSAANSNLVKRKLYTDVDTVTIRRQAVLGITSHNPTFTREDLADRMIIINFKRLEDKDRVAETLMLQEVNDKRNLIWGGIIHDIQQILAQPIPTSYPSFRIEDFARIGSWIAQGVGCMDEFAASISNVKLAQDKLVLDEDQLLVDSLLRYILKNQSANEEPTWETPASLYARLEAISPNSAGFTKKYRSAQMLSRKLMAFQEPLKKIILVEQHFDNSRGSRFWRISKKASENGHHAEQQN